MTSLPTLSFHVWSFAEDKLLICKIHTGSHCLMILEQMGKVDKLTAQGPQCSILMQPYVRCPDDRNLDIRALWWFTEEGN
jgi:hypothetical protein